MENESRTKTVAYYVISALFLAVALLFAIFKFQSSALRVLQALKDLVLSLGYYFSELLGLGSVTPTVGEIPDGMLSNLPESVQEFGALLVEFGKLLISWENLKEFLLAMALVLADIAQVLMLLSLPIACIVAVLSMQYSTPNNNYNEDTPALQTYKKVEKAVLLPLKRFIVGLFRFFFHSIYAKLTLLVWCWSLSVVTIVIEFVAYVFYFSISFDVLSLYVQLKKLLMDLAIPIAFVPVWMWVIIGFIIFDKLRRAQGLATLERHEAVNRNFLETHPGALFLVGKQRSGKTTIITSMALTQEVIFRDKAKEKLAERDKQFPFFPWINLERFFHQALERHELYTLAHCRRFIRTLRDCFYGKYDKATTRSIKKGLLVKKYGYTYDNFLFGYDYEKYGLKYNDNLRIIDVFEALENYLQEYYIYSAPTPLLFGNYAIRTDFTWIDYNNFPIYKCDFFDITPQEAEENTQYSHLFDYDSGRMLKKMDEENPNKDGFEVGCVNETEYAKERGNQNTNAGKKSTDKTVNARNDGHENDLKMRGHAATIDNFTFFRLLIDDQRADSLQAENRDLCDIVHIKKTGDERIVLPWFAFEEALYMIASAIYDKIYYHLRNLRGDNTLLVYLLKKIYRPIHNHYVRVYHQFGEKVSQLKVWDAMDDVLKSERGKFYISFKKSYSGRNATDSLKGYYHEKALNSSVGLNDYEMFTGLEMTTEQMKKLNSLFYNSILEILEKERRTKKWAS